MEESLIVQLLVVDSIDLAFIEPLDAFPILPQPKFDLVVLGNQISAQSVLLSFVPETLIAASVRPGVNTEAMLLVVFVLALVHSAIVPNVNAHPLHVVIEPLALVLAAIEPGVDSNA